MTATWAICIGLGGALGSLARAGFYVLTHSKSFWAAPLGSLGVNVLGSLLAGALCAVLMKFGADRGPWRDFLLVGFLGSFTTFSSFNLDNLALIREGQFSSLSLNILLNVGLSLGACLIGFVAIDRFLRFG